MTIEKEIELMNEIIVQAIIHGGDSGGPYNTNEIRLYKVIKKWFDEKEISSCYKIVQKKYIDYDNRMLYENIFTIVPVDDETETYHIPKLEIAF